MAKIKNLLDDGNRKSTTSKNAVDSYSSIKEKGNTIFEKKVSEIKETTRVKENPTTPTAITSIYRGTPVVKFESLDGVERTVEGVYKIIVNESMDLLYRTGSIEIAETRGYLDKTNLFNSLEGEKLKVKLKGIYEKEVFRTINFDVVDAEDTPWDNQTKFNLVETPFYRNYTKELIGRSFQNVKASELIGNILAENIKIDALKIIENPEDPKFPSFIFPNWTAEKCVRYLSRYSKKGPIKVFNISKREETVTLVAPLDYFLTGSVYSKEENMFPSTSDRVEGGYRLNQWKFYGPKGSDSINAVAGQTAISFSHLSSDIPQDFNTFNTDTYKFSKEEEEYASSAGGIYKNGVKLSSNNLGSRKIHLDSSSVKNHSLFITPEEKPLVEARLKSNFFQSYYNDLMLTSILPGNCNVNVGQIFNIILPDEIQQQGISTQRKIESLSGKWLLHDITHVLRPIPNTRELSYVMECTFYKVGLEVVHNFRKYENIG